MTRQDTAALLTLFSLYWPSFPIVAAVDGMPGTVDAWHEILERHTGDDCKSVLLGFRRERGRTFAPTASEFEGELEVIRLQRARDANMLQQHRLSSAGYGGKASAEKTFEFIKQLHQAVAHIAERKQIARPHTGPMLDETYDWDRCFARLEEAKRLAAPEGK